MRWNSVYFSNLFNNFVLNASVKKKKKAVSCKFLEQITVKVVCKTLLLSYLYGTQIKQERKKMKGHMVYNLNIKITTKI